MRGCPGSGKSFLAHRIAGRTGAKLFSADTFLTNGCGEYVWTIELTHEAHAICEHLVEIAMRKGERTIVVDNTHLRPKAAKVYVNLAKKHGYQIEVREPDTPWKYDLSELCKRNTHNLPQITLEQMLAIWLNIPLAGFEQALEIDNAQNPDP